MKKALNREKLLLVLAAMVIAITWFVGRLIETKSTTDQLVELFPQFNEFEQLDQHNFHAYNSDETLSTVFISKGYGKGYGGVISVFAEIDSMAVIQSVRIVNSSETKSFLKKVIGKGFLDEYKGKSIKSFTNPDSYPDAISGATYTSQGIHLAIIDALNTIGKKQFGIEFTHKKKSKFKFGLPEIALLLLYCIGLYLSSYKTKRAQLLRWIAIFLSIIFIGFIARKLLTLTQIGGYILAFWPNFYEFSFWYILLFGLIIGISLKGKNLYCDWVCPFGVVQEVLGKIGNAKSPKLKFREHLRWVQRLLALFAIALGLIYRDPSKTSFEVFSGFFAFIGSDVLFISLSITIVFALFIKNPWCNYLCPIKPSIDYIRKIREVLIKK